MKHFDRGVVFLLLCALPHAAQSFAHPGLSLNRAELDLIRSEINAQREPRFSGWQKMLSFRSSSLDWEPSPRSHVAADGGTSGGMADDILGAFSHALQWYVTLDERHAQKAIEILDGWADSLQTIDNAPTEYGRQEFLVAGWFTAPLCEAAEIIKHTYDGWAAEDIAAFEAMLYRVFYPLIKEHARENGNWEASMINSQIALGVFSDSTEVFERGVSFFRGEGRGALGVYVSETGEAQEICRDSGDLGHTQMGLGELVDAAEIAWHQDVDLYADLADPLTSLPRLAEGLEFAARILNGDTLETTCGPMSKPNYGLSNMWEKAWNHYGGRIGLDLPNVEFCVQRRRPEGESWKAMFCWGTLTHAELIEPVQRHSRPSPLPPSAERHQAPDNNLYDLAGRRVRPLVKNRSTLLLKK